MTSLYEANRPSRFWRLLDQQVAPASWSAAARAAALQLPPSARRDGDDIDALLNNTLGEGQFGSDHWRLPAAIRFYYAVKPLVPRALSRRLRQVRGAAGQPATLGWPIERRFADFQFELLRNVVLGAGEREASFIHFWPFGYQFAFVLTHDIETAAGQAKARAVATLEARYGFRSSFNFVAEGYPLDHGLIEDLRSNGFEIGVHGVKHDGKDFRSESGFMRRADRINRHLQQLGAVGYRSPLTHRNPAWMQALEIEYDSSFFDTDPHEPIAGGSMSIWPYRLGRFIELPYTLVQDHTLTAVLGETTPRLWLDKVDYLEANCGMALLNTHPDYLREPSNLSLYERFLQAMAARRSRYWHALPREVARWWRWRMEATSIESLEGAFEAIATVSDAPTRSGGTGVIISLPSPPRKVLEVEPMLARA